LELARVEASGDIREVLVVEAVVAGIGPDLLLFSLEPSRFLIDSVLERQRLEPGEALPAVVRGRPSDRISTHEQQPAVQNGRGPRALRSGDHEGRHQSRELGPRPDVCQRTAQSLLDGLWHAGDQPGWDVPPKRLREGSDALARGGAAPRALPGHDTSRSHEG